MLKRGLTIFILYSEVMPYVSAVWDVLINELDCNLTVVHWDKKKLTPYNFTTGNITSVPRSGETTDSMIQRLVLLQPDIVYVSGRMDRGYLKVARRAKKLGLPVIMGSDKQWRGNYRDYAAVYLSRILYKPYFTHAWIPGVRQYEYVKRIGFPENSILFDLYSGNVDLFNSFFERRQANPVKQDILFVGRLTDVKGVVPFVNVLSKLKAEGLFKGRLWLYGSGPLENVIPVHDWIIRKGFAAQRDLEEGILNSALFCLPSIVEAWGVVLHEMAAAGLPICCSSACGASTTFVKHGYNGFIFKSGDWYDLRLKLENLLACPADVQSTMGIRSHVLAQSITPRTAAISFSQVKK